MNDPLLASAPGTLRQGEIYVGGMLHQQWPIVPARQGGLEQAAAAAMRPEAFAYVAGSAGREATADANRAAFERWRIVPRMLRDVAARDMSVDLLGRRRPHPLLAAPIGVQELMHDQADLATARACAATQTPLVISTQASFPMEEIAAEMDGAPRWFQLYWGKSDTLVASLVSRAEACGCEAIVVTLDTPMLGWRTRDLDMAYLPFLEGRGIAQYSSDPVFQAMLGENADTQAAAVLFMATYSNPGVTWDRIAFLRRHTSLPILLKGILHPADAAQASLIGMDGVIVSNHGGRQIDGAIAALDALDAVVKRVGSSMPVLFDSGIRGGADIFKALALGARAVLVGRPYAYGLAVAGEAGVTAVLRNMIAELDLTMGLAGCRTVADITREMLA